MRYSSVFLVAGLLTLACSARQPAASTAGDTAAGQPRSGGQLSVPIPLDPFDWDISYQGKTSPNDRGLALGYNGLLGFKSGPEVEYAETILQPELAESWEVSGDGRTFTFSLRKSTRFANLPPVSGREFTSADVKWTLEYRSRTGAFKDKGLPQGQVDYMFDGLIGVDTPDPYTAIVRFKDPFVPFVNYAASRWNPMLPREIYEQDGHLKDRIAGTGPYLLDSAASQKGSRWVWKKNSNYWDTGKPYLDEIRWLVVPSEGTGYAAFQTKQVDILNALAYPDFQDVSKANPGVPVYKYTETNAHLLQLSQAKPGPLTDLRVRRALALSVDRDEINRAVAGGEGLWAVPGAMVGFFSDAEARQLERQDVEEAKRLLAEAGYGSGLDLDWPITREENQANLTWYQLVQAQLKRAGVNVTFTTLDKESQRARRRKGDYDIDVLVSSTGVLDADVDSNVYGRYISTSSQNYSRTNDPELDALLKASRQEVDPGKRREVLRDISRRIVDQVWTIDLIYVPKWDVWQPRVKNYRPHFSDYASYRNAWVEQ